jgi:hypothetical protein
MSEPLAQPLSDDDEARVTYLTTVRDYEAAVANSASSEEIDRLRHRMAQAAFNAAEPYRVAEAKDDLGEP